MHVTIDTNCLIDLEGRDPGLVRLLAHHEAGSLELQIPGIIASERLRTGGYAANFAAFAA
jgi:hypothetical protein